MKKSVFKEVQEADERIEKMKDTINKTLMKVSKYKMDLRTLEQKKVETEYKCMIEYMRKRNISSELLVETFGADGEEQEAQEENTNNIDEQNNNGGGENNVF